MRQADLRMTMGPRPVGGDAPLFGGLQVGLEIVCKSGRVIKQELPNA
jgi:hypothetical protein